MRRAYRNRPEEAFAALAERNGWRVTKRGWPDFLCFDDDGNIIAVEVKPRLANGRLQMLKKEQVATMTELSRHGIRCYVSDGETLERFDPDKHRPASPSAVTRRLSVRV